MYLLVSVCVGVGNTSYERQNLCLLPNLIFWKKSELNYLACLWFQETMINSQGLLGTIEEF